MKQELREIVDAFHKYNSENMALHAFGLRSDVTYDALVVAPGFSPFKLGMEKICGVSVLKEGFGYLLEKDGLKIAWIRTGSGAGNLIDYLALCAELSFKKMIFVGAVGALKREFRPGDVCTPEYCISGSHADAYLCKKSIRETMLFEKVTPDEAYADAAVAIAKKKGYEIKKAGVFCTPSIALEYRHLDEIRAFDTDLIEMETASFYLMADLFEIPAVALLVVSDNSASGAKLVGRTPEERKLYEYGRKTVLSDMVLTLAGN